MKYLPQFRGRIPQVVVAKPKGGRGGAFTLLEILVSVAIASLMIGMFSQVVGSTCKIWGRMVGSVDNYSRARTVLDSLQADLSKAVIRRDLGAFCDDTGNTHSALSFYVQRAGIDAPSTNRQLQLISYALQSGTSRGVMYRNTLPISWADASLVSFGENGSLPQLSNTSMDSEAAGRGILAVSTHFLNSQGIFTSDFSAKSTQAVIVSLVVIADKIDQILSDSQLDALRLKFNEKAKLVESDQTSAETEFKEVLDDPNIWKDYPSGIAGGIKVISRTYWLPMERSY